MKRKVSDGSHPFGFFVLNPNSHEIEKCNFNICVNKFFPGQQDLTNCGFPMVSSNCQQQEQSFFIETDFYIQKRH
jgi:hypothetical protein